MMTLSPTCVLPLRTARRQLPLLMLCLAICAIGFGSATAHGGAQQEQTHSFSHLEDGGLTWDTSYTTNFEVPLFDTLGGTRELKNVRAAFSVYGLSYEMVIAPNTSGETVYDTVEWHTFWNITNDATGDFVFPIPDYPQDWDLGVGGRGVQEPDGFAGEVIPPTDLPTDPGVLELDYADFSGGAFLDTYRDLFTGTGTLTLNSEIILTMQHVEDEFFGGTFTPGFLTINPEAVRLDLAITYVYSSVPTPGALALFGLAGITSRRRRRA